MPGQNARRLPPVLQGPSRAIGSRAGALPSHAGCVLGRHRYGHRPIVLRGGEKRLA